MVSRLCWAAGPFFSPRGLAARSASRWRRGGWESDDPGFAARRRLLDEVAARLGASLDVLALAAALAQPWADVVLSGAVSPPMLDSNLSALGIRWDETLERRLAALGEEPDRYWSRRAALPWT